MANIVLTDGTRIDVNDIETGSIEEAVGIISPETCISYETVAFVLMVCLMPHLPGLSHADQTICMSNPVQGIVFHYLVSEFLCWACLSGYIKGVRGLSTSTGAGEEASECSRVQVASFAKMEELKAMCSKRRITVPELDGIFFHYAAEPLILKGDLEDEQMAVDAAEKEDNEHGEEGGEESEEEEE